MVTMRSAGKANMSDMAALLDHADSDMGCYVTVGLGIPRPCMHSTQTGEQLVTVFRREHTFSEQQ